MQARITLLPWIWFCFFALGAGCTSMKTRIPIQQQCLETLAKDMRENAGWTRIHAADALLDHHETGIVWNVFAPLPPESEIGIRIGTWRVLARASSSEGDRAGYVDRIRAAMRDASAQDRLQAVESLCKLGAIDPADLEVVMKWITSATEAETVFPCWYLAMMGNSSTRQLAEQKLSELLDSTDDVARLRAAYAIGWFSEISPALKARINGRWKLESEDSPARTFMIISALRHAPDPLTEKQLCNQLAAIAQSNKGQYQSYAAAALGQLRCDRAEDVLAPLLENDEVETRIGAANGLLYLMR